MIIRLSFRIGITRWRGCFFGGAFYKRSACPVVVGFGVRLAFFFRIRSFYLFIQISKRKHHIKLALNLYTSSSSSLSFGLFPIRGRHSRYLYFYNKAFVLRSDALPATNPLFGGKTGLPVFHIKAGVSR